MKKSIHFNFFLMGILLFLLMLCSSQVSAELLVVDHDGAPYPAIITEDALKILYDSDTNPDDDIILPGSPTNGNGNSELVELYWLNALLENDITGDPYFKYEYEEVDGPNLSSSLTISSNYNWEYGVFKFGGWFIAIENDGDAEINFSGIDFSSLDGFVNGVSINSLSHYTLFNTSPVPEPATMLLLGSGLVGIAGLRRKLKK